MKKIEVSKMMGDLIRLTWAGDQKAADKFIKDHTRLLFQMTEMLLQAEEGPDGSILEPGALSFAGLVHEYAG